MRIRFRRHVAERDLIRIADSANGSALEDRHRAHLEGCPRCAARLAAHRQLARLMALPWAETRVIDRRPSLVSRVSLAKLAFVFVVVLGIGLGLRTFVAAPRESLPGVGGTPAASSLGHPTANVSPPIASLMPLCPEGPVVPGGGPAPAQGLTLSIVQPPRLDSVHWSPDGRHVLLAGGGVELLDSSGVAISTIAGAEAAAWLDSDTYATGSNCESGSAVGTVTIHSMAGSNDTLSGTYDTTMMLGNGHGALALAPRALGVAEDPRSTVVWAGGSLSMPTAGAPLAWSPDGDRLLVTAGARSGGAAAGGSSRVHGVVVTWPGLTVAATLADLWLDPLYEPVFSPDGRFVAISCGALSDVSDCGQFVADTASGTVKSVGNQPPGLPLTWLSTGHLLLAPAAYGTPGPLLQWDGVGLVTGNLVGAWGVASSSGGVAIETAAMGDGGTTHILDSSGAPATDLPGAIAVYWSPDGTHLLLRVDSTQDLILVRLK